MRLHRLLVAIDFTPASEQGARWVGRAFAPAAQLILAHVIELPEVPTLYRHGHARRELLLETLRIGAAERLRALMRVVPRSRPEIRQGEFADVVNGLAASEDADMIVVGAHTARPDDWEQSMGGAELVIAHARVPVLVIADALPGSPRTILAAVDSSPQAAPVLAWSSEVAQQFGGTVTAVHVVASGLADTALAAAEVVFGVPPVSLADVAGAALTAPSAGWRKVAPDAGVTPNDVSRTVVVGDPAQEILATAARIGADLIVLGHRQHGGLRRALLGSVVHRVLREATCPVLVVPEVPAAR